MLADAGLLVVAALISPYRADRATARQLHERQRLGFLEVYLDAPLHVCEQRDPKSLYARARRGEIEAMTGIDAPYEKPEAPDVVLATGRDSIASSTEQLLQAVFECDLSGVLRTQAPVLG